ncbi:MAG: methyltransferase, partial [Myxococcota bacterium]
ILHAAARLEIADHLREGPLTVAQLASRCEAKEETLRRFMQALVMLGVVSAQERRGPDEEERFALTPTGHWLRADVPGSLRASALMCGDRSFFEAWRACDEAVRTGRPSFESAVGASFFEHLDAHPELLNNFQVAMTGFPMVNNLLLETYDFGSRQAVLDVGGGTGSLVRAIVDRHPDVVGMVLDRPSVIAANRREGRADDRISWIGGDFLDAIPSGADTHVLRFVLSDWSDASTVRILTLCRQALPGPEGRLLIVDNLQPEGQPDFTAALDMTMLVLTGGAGRTEAAYVELLQQAGLRHLESLTTPARATIMVAAPDDDAA